MNKKKKIAKVITTWLIVIVMTACIATAGLTYYTLLKRSERSTAMLVRQNVEDVSNDIDQLADLSILNYAGQLMYDYITSSNLEDPDSLSKELHDYYKDQGVEINVVNSDGIIVASSVPEYIGYDMHNGEQASEFLVLLDGKTKEYVQDMKGVSYDENILMKYAGKSFDDGSGFLQVGLTNEVYYDEIAEKASVATTNRRIGKSGYILVVSDELNIINSYHNDHTEQKLSDSGIIIDPAKKYSYEHMKCDVFGVRSYVNINEVKGSYIIGVYPVSETYTSVNMTINTTVFLETIVFAILLIALILMLRKRLVKNILKINNSLTEITEGNLDERVEVRDTYEFDALSTDINATVDRLKGYIAEAEARIAAELALAAKIQTDMLPRRFPPFPGRNEFDIYATMNPAKEVGGDFYDFFLIDDDHLALVIADVSGKGIPAALFMVNSKTLIKNRAQMGGSVSEIISYANEHLREEDDELMFVTVWMAVIEISTGKGVAVNAGHEHPALKRAGGEFELIEYKHSPALAMMDGIPYPQHEFELNPGDVLFVYTDGVAEATNADEKLFGTDRMIEALNREDTNEPEKLLANVKADIDDFVKDAPQFDDITMLAVAWHGKI